MKETTVWVDAWQMQCCGDAFIIGSKIEWDIVPYTFELPPVTEISSIDYYYDAHSAADTQTITGTVTEIYSVYQKYELEPTGKVQIPVAGKLIKCDREADGWHTNIEEYRFAAYFVWVNDYEIA